MIAELLEIANVTKDDVEWGLQFNLTHAAIAHAVARCGIYDRLRYTLESYAIIRRGHESEIDWTKHWIDVSILASREYPDPISIIQLDALERF